MRYISIAILLCVLSVYACSYQKYTVYFIPLDVNLYGLPTVTELKEWGVCMKMNSLDIDALFSASNDNCKVVSKTIKANYDYRVLINRNADNEIILITRDFNVTTIDGKLCDVDSVIIRNVMSELKIESQKYDKWNELDYK